MKRLSLSLNKILCFTLLCTAIAVPLWGALFMIKLKLGSFGKLFEWVSVKRNIFGVNGRVFILIWFHLVSEIPLGFQSTQFNAQPDIIGGWMNLHQIHFCFVCLQEKHYLVIYRNSIFWSQSFFPVSSSLSL